MSTAATAVIRAATASDAEAIACIYNHYVRVTIVTFEEDPVAAGALATRIAEIAAVGLHEKFGMTKVAHFREVGFKFGQWIDVAY